QALDEWVRERYMRHRFDFIDLQNPQVRHPPVRFEERIVIRTEMSRYALPMDSGVEHAADVGTRRGATVHAEADEATRELVHDHEHPVASEHDGLTAKEVHAPETVCRAADERQPRGPAAVRSQTIMFRQHARDDVLIDLEPERLRNDARNPRTAE